jgi:hypothetical protein
MKNTSSIFSKNGGFNGKNSFDGRFNDLNINEMNILRGGGDPDDNPPIDPGDDFPIDPYK